MDTARSVSCAVNGVPNQARTPGSSVAARHARRAGIIAANQRHRYDLSKEGDARVHQGLTSRSYLPGSPRAYEWAI